MSSLSTFTNLSECFSIRHKVEWEVMMSLNLKLTLGVKLVNIQIMDRFLLDWTEQVLPKSTPEHLQQQHIKPSATLQRYLKEAC